MLLSPVVRFLTAIGVEILIGFLKGAGVLVLLGVAAIGVIGWTMLRKLRVRPRGRAPVEP
jgi:hypothetical protein